ncbi:hypothetical protein HYPP_01833 [Hyphomicrobium sp. ghe19]|nr:hypothetical protein HYPP_01833 [Hyphomicrobium sp. ghe19]
MIEGRGYQAPCGSFRENVVFFKKRQAPKMARETAEHPKYGAQARRNGLQCVYVMVYRARTQRFTPPPEQALQAMRGVRAVSWGWK